jgi:hypothetical protein
MKIKINIENLNNYNTAKYRYKKIKNFVEELFSSYIPFKEFEVEITIQKIKEDRFIIKFLTTMKNPYYLIEFEVYLNENNCSISMENNKNITKEKIIDTFNNYDYMVFSKTIENVSKEDFLSNKNSYKELYKIGVF